MNKKEESFAVKLYNLWLEEQGRTFKFWQDAKVKR